MKQSELIDYRGNKRYINAWAFYDWANSAYSLVISSAIFPIFYSALFSSAGVEYVAVFGGVIRSTPLISYLTAAAFIVVAISAPLLSGISDFVGNKKVFLKFYCYLGAFSCMGLYFFDLEYIYFGLLCYFFGLIGFWGSIVFYNSYLPDIAHPEQQDAVSAKGFSLGYIGSVLLLIVNLAMVMNPGFFGFEDSVAGKMEAMRWSFVMVGLWWMGFSQYTFYVLPKGAGKPHKVTRAVVFNGYAELKSVYNALSDNLRLKRYLMAFFVYSMAVQTIMLVATYFGEQEIAWPDEGAKTTGLIVSILIIQILAMLGAQMTSKASKKYGNIKTLIAINSVWAAMSIYAYFMISPVQFYVAAGIVGLVMGGIQALSRSTYSKYLPRTEDTASYFSFYDVAEKIGIVIGMLLYGFIDQITGSMRNSVLFLIVFFISGIVLLLRVPDKIKS
jgi:UMF1 family MFS transporter